jgi:hypothetical protein
MTVYDSRGARNGDRSVTFLWGFGAAGVTVATWAGSQTVRASGTDWGAVLIALITAAGAVAAAYVASRRRSRGRELGEDELIVSREEYERLRDLERRRRAR